MARFNAALVVVAAVLVTAGCRSAPVVYDHTRFDSNRKVAAAARDFWETRDMPRGGLAALAGSPAEPPRVAVIEFSVEFVTDKTETPFKRQAAAQTTEYGPVGLPIALFGVGRVSVVYDETLKEKLPLEMYRIFQSTLEESGVSVVPIETVAASPAYSRLKPARPGATEFLQLFNFVSSDTGKPKRIEYWPAEPLVTIKGPGAGSLDRLEADLARELSADALLRVRMVVDVWRGLAAFGRDSSIRLVSPPYKGRVISRSSLVSSDLVVDESRWRAFKGRVYPVDDVLFSAALDEVWPVYCRMAVDILVEGGAPGQ